MLDGIELASNAGEPFLALLKCGETIAPGH
jgi:hypothetical protein